MKNIYGIEVSHTLVSKITDRILPLAQEWQNISLDAIYSIIFMDVIYYKFRSEGRIITKAVYDACTEDVALSQLSMLEEKWNDKYAIVLRGWRDNWDELATYFKYPEEIKTLIYTTDAIES